MKELSAYSACPGFNASRALSLLFATLALTFASRAEEKPNSLLTALASTTISGYVQTYVGGIQLPHRVVVFGIGAISNSVINCAVATEAYEVLSSGTVGSSGARWVRGKIPGIGFFRGRIDSDGQTFHGRIVFTQGEHLRVRRFTLTRVP